MEIKRLYSLDQADIAKFEEAGKIGKKALETAVSLIEPGITLYEVAEKTERLIIENGAFPAFPLNLSINNEAAHYTPFYGDKKTFRTGDIVKVDIGAHIDGFPSDNAATVEVGGAGNHSDLIDASREALNAAIKVLRPLIPLREIGAAIGAKISEYGFKPIRNLGGHGVARYDLHSSIFVPNYDDGNGKLLKPDQVIAIEPFASTGIGMIHSGPGGNIFIVSGTKNDKDEPIFRNFSTLPFASRWLYGKIEKPEAYLKSMVSRRTVSQFPILREHNGSLISQAEHTIMILGDRIKVLTS